MRRRPCHSSHVLRALRISLAVIGLSAGSTLVQAADDLNGQGLAELQYDPVPVNLPPTVKAWIETDSGNVEQTTIPFGQSAFVNLNGSVSDDKPPGANFTLTWSKQSGPGTMRFCDPNYPNDPSKCFETLSNSRGAHAIQFSTAGTQPYILALTANDGELQTTATVSVTVTGTPTPPTVNAGKDQTLERPVGQSVGTTLHATAQNATTFAWSKVSGPNSVQLGDTTSKDLQLTFTDLGTYVFRIRASNGSLYAEDDVQVTVTPPNTAPTVTINPKYRQQTITLPTNTVNLSANITDDGHPKSSLVSVWKCKSGPACAGVTGVTFSNKRKTFTSTPVSGIHDTVVTFPATPGLYKIRIVANDGALKAQRIVTVTVQPQVARPPSTKRISDDGADPQALSIDGPLVAWGDTRHLVPYSQPATPGDIYLYDAERPVEPRVMWISQIAFGERPFVSDNNRIVWVNNAPTGVEALYICTYNREAGTCPPQLILPAPRSSPDVPTMSGNRIVYLGNSFFINDHGYKDTAEDIYTCAYDPRTNQCPEQRLTDFRDGFPINDEVEVEGSRLVFPYRIGGTTNKNIFTCLIPGSGQCSPIPLTTSNNAWQPSFDGNRAVWLAGNSVSLYDFSNPNRPALPLPLSRGAKWADISGDRVIWAAGSGIFLYRISTGQTQQVLTRPNMAEYYTGQISGERIVWFEYNSNTKRSEIWMHDLGTAP